MVQEKRTRSVPFNVRMTPAEHAMLLALAEHEGLSASDVVRQYVRNRYRKVFGDQPPKRRRR